MKTTITLEKETAQALNILKYSMCVTSLDDVIKKLIDNYSIHKEEVEQYDTADIDPTANEDNI